MMTVTWKRRVDVLTERVERLEAAIGDMRSQVRVVRSRESAADGFMKLLVEREFLKRGPYPREEPRLGIFAS